MVIRCTKEILVELIQEQLREYKAKQKKDEIAISRDSKIKN
jgi:hypothetical protein